MSSAWSAATSSAATKHGTVPLLQSKSKSKPLSKPAAKSTATPTHDDKSTAASIFLSHAAAALTATTATQNPMTQKAVAWRTVTRGVNGTSASSEESVEQFKRYGTLSEARLALDLAAETKKKQRLDKQNSRPPTPNAMPKQSIQRLPPTHPVYAPTVSNAARKPTTRADRSTAASTPADKSTVTHELADENTSTPADKICTAAALQILSLIHI